MEVIAHVLSWVGTISICGEVLVQWAALEREILLLTEVLERGLGLTCCS